MQSSAKAELRQFPRHSVGRSQLLTADVVRESGVTQHSIVLDISEGGAALQLLGAPIGNGVSKMRLNFPALETPLETSARLAWLAPNGRAGIHFEKVGTPTREAIREWLRSQPVQLHPTEPEPTAIIAPELDDFGVTLGIIAERAMARTGAKGAAIAVGNNEFMVCCASIGQAPAIHAPLRPDSGLSGFCLRTGKDLYCMDAMHDERVDPEVARELNLRSAALLPVHVSGSVVGILELFSDEPNAFGAATTRDRLGRLLQFLAAAIAEYQPTEEAAQLATEPPTNDNVPERAEAPVAAEPSADVHSSVDDFRELLSLQPPKHTTGVPRTVIIVFALLAIAAATFWFFMQERQSVSTSSDPQPYETAAASADTVPPLVGLAPSAISTKAGDPFSVDVVLSNAQKVSSVGLLIVHDPNTIKVVAVSAGDLLGPAGTLVHREQSGQIQVTASVASPSAPISGSGILCTVYFFAKSPGTSTLSVNQLTVRDSAMRPASAQSSDATVTVTR